MTTDGTADERCAELRDALTEVALGVADGTTRGVVMAHLATCERCRDELSSLADAADELLLLVPERDPSADFEGRVLAQLTPDQGARSPTGPDQPAEPIRPTTIRRHRAQRAVLAAALGAGLLAVGGTGVWLATAPDRELATSYRATLDTANGRYLAAADLTTEAGPEGSAQSVGTVFLYEGEPSWAYVVVRDAGPAANYDVVVTVEDGSVAGPDTGADAAGGYPYEADPDRADSAEANLGTDPSSGTRDVPLGACVVEAHVCTAGGVLDVPVHDVLSVRLTTPDGETWSTASLP
ncbi:zf-HC2 domain-containing protein [Promicromonospora panici]|uniref:zf-HC2 domain-containing protein n=1 Tax=Promicromonospora panici TaxID=2219658 RepID=UPI00101B64F7|nr:zf-HC2 domain-containing protein [Promicromonospora panici]